MRVEGLTIALRERSPWEAVDLGVALVRAHAGRILPAWLLAGALLCAACIGVGALLGLPWLGGLLLWWCKPLLDRIPLYVLSRVVLGEQPGFRDAWRAGWRWNWSALWPWLLWRRLHPGRCLLLAMDMLERPRGEARRQRARVLGALHGSPHALLTIVGVHLEAMLTFSFIALVLMFVPLEFLDDTLKAAFDALMEDPPAWLDAANTALYWLALALFEPFYIGAGFALYLNRRTQIEAWDVELAFRRLAARLAALPAALLLALGLLLALDPAPARAAPVEPPVEADTAAEAAFAAAMARAMQDPLLAPRELRGEWQARKQDAPERGGPTPAWLEALVGFFALVAENILWLLLAVAVVLLATHWQRLRRLWPGAAAPPSAPRPAATLLAAEAPLPADLPAAVQALWEAGQPRAALALLYRGALHWLAVQLDQPLPPGTTEAEALRRARRLAAPAQAAFAAVVRRWQAAAYAGRLPSRGELDELLGQWRAGSASAPP
jgi:hypothetical protein